MRIELHAVVLECVRHVFEGEINEFMQMTDVELVGLENERQLLFGWDVEQQLCQRFTVLVCVEGLVINLEAKCVDNDDET